MKNLLYVISGLLLVIWGILFWGLYAKGPVHLLLLAAGLVVLVRIIFDEGLSNRK